MENTPRLFESGYALFIGIQYQHWLSYRPLYGTEYDIENLVEHFTDAQRAAYKPENVKALNERAATTSSILEELDALAIKVQQDPNATVIIYYSGHGVTDGKDFFLVPYDFDIERWRQTEISRYEANKVINAQLFAKNIAAIKAKKSLVILDCCHAENIPVQKSLTELKPNFSEQHTTDGLLKGFLDEIDRVLPKTVDGVTKDLVEDVASGRGHVILTSCEAHETSLDLGTESLFTQVFLECLSGKGTIEKMEKYALPI